MASVLQLIELPSPNVVLSIPNESVLVADVFPELSVQRVVPNASVEQDMPAFACLIGVKASNVNNMAMAAVVYKYFFMIKRNLLKILIKLYYSWLPNAINMKQNRRLYDGCTSVIRLL